MDEKRPRSWNTVHWVAKIVFIEKLQEGTETERLIALVGAAEEVGYAHPNASGYVEVYVPGASDDADAIQVVADALDFEAGNENWDECLRLIPEQD